MLDVISTGSKALDLLLNNGIKRGLLYCIFGPAGSGKTQLCMQLTVNALKSYSSKYVLIVDAKGEFKIERVVEMMKYSYSNANYSYSNANFTDRIYINRVYNANEIFNSINYIDTRKSLVIVEDAPQLFRLEYGSNSMEGNFMLMRLMHRLAVNALLMNTAVVVTNGVASVIEEQGQEYRYKYRQIMDRAVSMFAHYKLMLTRLNSYDNYTIVKATLIYPLLSFSNEALFKIGADGIKDI
jgi:RecA/RadA recombinase